MASGLKQVAGDVSRRYGALLLAIIAGLAVCLPMASAMEVTITAIDAAAAEAGSDTGSFRITRDDTTTAITISFTVTGSAVEVTDYGAIGTSVMMAIGQASADVIITPVDDALIEGTETVQLTLQSGAGYTVGTPSNATVTVTDNDPPTVTIIATDPSASEPGIDTGQFTISRTGGTTGFLVVNITVTGTANNGSDYTNIPVSVTIPGGQASASIAVTPLDDLTVEGNETVVLTIQSNAAYIVGNPFTATVTLTDNESPTITLTATDATAAEPGTDTGRFTFTRNGAFGDDLTVNFSVGGSALEGTDYSAIGVAVMIPGGSPSITVTIVPLDDAIFEGPENIVVQVEPGVGYFVGDPNQATVNLNDNERPVVTITAPDSVATEAIGDFGTMTITRTATIYGTYPGALTVSLSNGGTASGGSDYNALSNSINIPDTQASISLTISPIDDANAEDPETVICSLIGTANYTVGVPSSATVTINDNDLPLITMSVVDGTAAEPGADTARFTVTRSGAILNALTVNFTVGGTATDGVDFNTIGTSVVIPATQASATITITPINDAFFESTETVVVTLAVGAGYLIGTPSSATANLNDDDKPTVVVTATDNTAAEAGSSTGTFEIVRSATVYGTYPGPLTVYFTMSGTASSAADYTPLTSPIVIPDGVSSFVLTLTPVNDTLAEDPETAILNLAANSQYTIGAPANATITIADNDLPVVTITVTDPTATEPGADTGTFTITRSGRILEVLTVNITTVGTATSGVDFAALGNTVQIPFGDLSTTITVTPFDDGDIENTETVIVNVAAGATYNVGTPNSATVNLNDDDFPTISIDAADPDASEPNTDTATFTITRTPGFAGGYPGAVTVNFTVSGTATSGTDYNALGTSVIIPDGQASVDLVLTPRDDGLIEGTETVQVTLANGPNYVVGAPNSASIDLLDNDFPVVTVTATDNKAAEPGSDTALFTIKRVGGNTDLIVSYAISGTATLNDDYVAIPNAVLIPAGQTQVTLPITAIDDSLYEGNETVIITIVEDPGVYVTGATPAATVTIYDDEKPEIDLILTDGIAAEPGTDTATITVRRSPTANATFPGALVVNFTVSGTAKSGSDYTAVTAATIPDGSQTATVTITPKDDTVIEGPETVIITLKSATTYNLGVDTQTVTINDNDFPIVTIAATDNRAAEPGKDEGTFTITRVGGLTDLNVEILVTGTATEGVDFETLETTVTIPAGKNTATVTITAFDDLEIEGDEAVTISIVPLPEYVLGADSVATVLIKDNDRANIPPVVSTVTVSPNPAPIGLPTTFFASVSDADGDTVTYIWDFGDGTILTSETGAAASVTHAYSAYGIYNVTVTVDDGYGGVVIERLTVRIINTGDGRFYGTKASFFINRQGDRTAGNFITDEITLTGFINPAGLPSNLAGATLKLKVNGTKIAPDQVLNARGSSSAPNITYKLSAKTGAFAFNVGDLDLAKLFAIGNISGNPPLVAKVELEIAKVSILSPIWTGDVEFVSRSVADVAAEGTYTYQRNRLLTGAFLAVKTSAIEVSGGHIVSITGPLLANGSLPIAPESDISVVIGGERLTVPLSVLLMTSKENQPTVWTYDPNAGTIPGVEKFTIDNIKKTFTIATGTLANVGLPFAAVGESTSHNLPFEVELDVPEGRWTFATTIELLRTKAKSTKWRR